MELRNNSVVLLPIFSFLPSVHYFSLPPSHCFLYTYIYIYMCAVELKIGPRFGVSSVKNWSKSSVKNWSKFFAVFPNFIVFWGHF